MRGLHVTQAPLQRDHLQCGHLGHRRRRPPDRRMGSSVVLGGPTESYRECNGELYQISPTKDHATELGFRTTIVSLMVFCFLGYQKSFFSDMFLAFECMYLLNSSGSGRCLNLEKHVPFHSLQSSFHLSQKHTAHHQPINAITAARTPSFPRHPSQPGFTLVHG